MPSLAACLRRWRALRRRFARSSSALLVNRWLALNSRRMPELFTLRVKRRSVCSNDSPSRLSTRIVITSFPPCRSSRWDALRRRAPDAREGRHLGAPPSEINQAHQVVKLDAPVDCLEEQHRAWTTGSTAY